MTSQDSSLSSDVCDKCIFKIKELIYCNLGLIHIEFKAQSYSVKS